MKNLIIAVCGDDSQHKIWLSQEHPNFDLFVVYYGDQNRYCSDGLFFANKKGTKFNIVKQLDFSIIEQYDAVVIPDDDLYLTAKDWNRFFDLFHQHQLELAQPSVFGWQCTTMSATHSEYILRYTNWVEIMAPCFSKNCLQKVKHTFGMNETDWGIDYLWVKLLNYPQDRVAIIDDVVAIHTRPCFFGDTYWRNNNTFEKAVKEIYALGDQYQIDLENLITYGGVKRTKKEYDDLPSENKFLPNSDILKEFASFLKKKQKVFI